MMSEQMMSIVIIVFVALSMEMGLFFYLIGSHFDSIEKRIAELRQRIEDAIAQGGN